MTRRHPARAALLAPLVASGLALSGCMSSPTYGTDKTASEQLVGDLSNAFSIAPQKRPAIDYKPRPALVKPAPGQKEVLPAGKHYPDREQWLAGIARAAPRPAARGSDHLPG